jgi:hypothetical protein
MAVAYVVINDIRAYVLDEAGDLGPGALIVYSAVVISSGNPVIMPDTGGVGSYVSNRQVSINFAAVVTEATVQAQILADLQSTWQDSTITAVFL